MWLLLLRTMDPPVLLVSEALSLGYQVVVRPFIVASMIMAVVCLLRMSSKLDMLVTRPGLERLSTLLGMPVGAAAAEQPVRERLGHLALGCFLNQLLPMSMFFLAAFPRAPDPDTGASELVLALLQGQQGDPDRKARTGRLGIAWAHHSSLC